eukprot:364194-Chlamydomonas_euryale.AAC.3
MGQPAHTPPQRPPGAEGKEGHKGRIREGVREGVKGRCVHGSADVSEGLRGSGWLAVVLAAILIAGQSCYAAFTVQFQARTGMALPGWLDWGGT